MTLGTVDLEEGRYEEATGVARIPELDREVQLR
jgi:hypothetical protein